jgi:phosphoesterase RecJ-like protein
MNGAAAEGETPVIDINIDHHVTNLTFARYNLVMPEAVATAEVLTDCLRSWHLPINTDVAAALVTGIITDTLGFRTSNVSPKALRTTADLMEYGVNMPELYMRSLVQRSFEAVRYWSAGLSTMEKENGMVWATLTQADRQAAGYPGRDDADLINILSSIGEADVTMIFVEQPGEGVKVSWRARPGVDVSQVALRFGGGGHPAAAGAEIPGTLEEVRQMVLQETRLLLAELPASQPA